MLIVRNKGFHKSVLTILPWSLFNTLMVLSYSAFVSKLFISNNSLILRLYMLGNFVRGFGCSQLNCSQSLECSVAPDASHFPFMVSSWCSIDRVSTRFLSLQFSSHNHKRWNQSLVKRIHPKKTYGRLLVKSYLRRLAKNKTIWVIHKEQPWNNGKTIEKQRTDESIFIW